MQFFRVKRLAAAGAVALSMALGAVAAVGVAEVGAALAQQDNTELDGVVEVLPAAGLIGTWQVGGTTIQVTETTEIDQAMGSVNVGVQVEVEGTAQADGSILATEIEVEDMR
jgi:hypothetical protein